jgi:hypothetical protein
MTEDSKPVTEKINEYLEGSAPGRVRSITDDAALLMVERRFSSRPSPRL